MTEGDLAGFCGSDEFYEHWTKRLRYTQGVKYMADQGGAYWLIDAIASHQLNPKLRKGRLADFQLWTLTVKDSEGVLECREDSGYKPAVTQRITFTDFPFNIKLYVEGRMLMLPQER